MRIRNKNSITIRAVQIDKVNLFIGKVHLFIGKVHSVIGKVH